TRSPPSSSTRPSTSRVTRRPSAPRSTTRKTPLTPWSTSAPPRRPGPRTNVRCCAVCDSTDPQTINRSVVLPEDAGAVVDRARTGDEDAWEALYRRVYPRLYAYAQRRLDADRARDAVSETMARAVARIEHYHPIPGSGGFDGWLFGICRHVVLDAQ